MEKIPRLSLASILALSTRSALIFDDRNFADFDLSTGPGCKQQSNGFTGKFMSSPSFSPPFLRCLTE